MKVRVSILDDLFRKAEAAAGRLGLTRSQLYAAAIRDFLDRRRANDVTALLNEIYSKESSKLDSALNSAQLQSLKTDDWQG